MHRAGSPYKLKLDIHYTLVDKSLFYSLNYFISKKDFA